MITPPMTAMPSGARNCAPSPRPSATGIIPAMRANVVIRIGRNRIAPASMSASRRGFPSFSRAHFAKSMSRIAFFATMPISIITPISVMMLIVLPVIASETITPISDNGNEIMIATGSKNEPNCTTKIKYISIRATPSAKKICPNTSPVSFASPPDV